MEVFSPIVKRVDHLMIRIVDSAYDHLFSLLTETLQLPITWPMNNYIPSFKTGGVFAGNISMELFQSGSRQTLPSPSPSQAQLYGIAFEPFSLTASLQALDSRALPHTSLIPVPPSEPDTMGTMWTLLYLTNLLECDPPQSGSSTRTANNGDGDLTSLFDQQYPYGMVFFCAYNAAFYDTTQGRLNKRAELQTRHGGPLGLEGVQEIVVGLKDVETAREHWQHLFAPVAPLRPDVWHLEDGPAIRLVPHAHDGLVTLVWKVASLERAKAFLSKQNMLGTWTEQRVSVALPSLFGLDIQLVE